MSTKPIRVTYRLRQMRADELEVELDKCKIIVLFVMDDFIKAVQCVKSEF